VLSDQQGSATLAGVELSLKDTAAERLPSGGLVPFAPRGDRIVLLIPFLALVLLAGEAGAYHTNPLANDLQAGHNLLLAD
jgi:hypothetical protein